MAKFRVVKFRQFMTSRGVYFSADLYLNSNKVADIENKGDGGCTWISWTDKAAEATWTAKHGKTGLNKSDNAVEKLIQEFEKRS